MASAKVNLEQINEEIMIYESLMEREFSDKVVNNLIMLYKKVLTLMKIGHRVLFFHECNQLQTVPR